MGGDDAIEELAVLEGMSDGQLDSFLEVIARLIEATASSVDDAARIVREAKTDRNADQ